MKEVYALYNLYTKELYVSEKGHALLFHSKEKAEQYIHNFGNTDDWEVVTVYGSTIYDSDFED